MNSQHMQHRRNVRRVQWFRFQQEMSARMWRRIINIVAGLLVAFMAGQLFTLRAQASACDAMIMPIRNATILQAFDEPSQPWLAGHRGIDMSAHPGDTLIAPTHGVIHFAGLVGGKSVVTIMQGGRTLTFEPAQTTYQVGTRLTRGQAFARVQGNSDHCETDCVHWGIRLGQRRYADPTRFLQPVRIALIPVA